MGTFLAVHWLRLPSGVGGTGLIPHAMPCPSPLQKKKSYGSPCGPSWFLISPRGTAFQLAMWVWVGHPGAPVPLLGLGPGSALLGLWHLPIPARRVVTVRSLFTGSWRTQVRPAGWRCGRSCCRGPGPKLSAAVSLSLGEGGLSVCSGCHHDRGWDGWMASLTQ